MIFSILPAVVSLLFLGYGFHVIFAKGLNRTTGSFFALCISTFAWQAAWALLFRTKDPTTAHYLVKFGWLLILFLPTTLYHFLTEISGRIADRRYVYFSYGVAFVLACFLFTTDLVVSGYYTYYFGPYPKAGPLHAAHLVQTWVVVIRGLYLTYRQQRVVDKKKRAQLRLCTTSLFIYVFAGADYLCNYGIEFYPPGLFFLAISLGIIAYTVIRHDLMNPMALAATVAHEMRTPLATIRLQAAALSKFLPDIYRGYQLAVQHGLCEPVVRSGLEEQLFGLSSRIAHEVDRSNAVIDMMLASARMNEIDSRDFRVHAIGACVDEALQRYPFSEKERRLVHIAYGVDFTFHGSDTLLVFVLFNLIKNALFAVRVADKGEIRIATARHPDHNSLSFTDTASGIDAEVLPYIFDDFYSTKHGRAGGAGIGLAFCSRVMASFGGRIRCESVVGEYTTFTLDFPVLAGVVARHAGAEAPA